MFKIDDAFLADLGLGALPQAEKEAMKHHIYETLEMRVGMKLAQQMTNEQLDEFEAFINRNDDAGALRWLETNFPNYKQVVADELENLRQEVKNNAPQILAASAQNAAAPADPAVQSSMPATPSPLPQSPPQPSQPPQPAQQPYQPPQPQMPPAQQPPFPQPQPQQQPQMPPSPTPADPGQQPQPYQPQPYQPPQPPASQPEPPASFPPVPPNPGI